MIIGDSGIWLNLPTSKCINMKYIALLSLILIFPKTIAMSDSFSAIPLKLSPMYLHEAVVKVLDDGNTEIHTTGTDPFVLTEDLSIPLDPKLQHVLSFEYFSTTGTNAIQIFLAPAVSEEFSEFGSELIPSQGWSVYSVNLKTVLERYNGVVKGFRIDFGTESGKTIRIRNLRIRAENTGEIELAIRRESYLKNQKLMDSRLNNYLVTAYPHKLTNVQVDEKNITVKGRLSNVDKQIFLAEAPIFDDLLEMKKFPFIHPVAPNSHGDFTVIFKRFGKHEARSFDRLLSRWVIITKTKTGYTLCSHARYPDVIEPKYQLPEERPRNKKGLGGLGIDRPIEDLDSLHISAATVNIVLNSLFHTQAAPGRTAFKYCDSTYYSDNNSVLQLDKTLLEAAKRKIIISAIILIGQSKGESSGSYSKLLAHPDADPSGIYAMPNVSSADGVETYAASLNFLASRYSRPDNKYGRIHDWIMHNEVNAGWIWTNAGDKTALLYMDIYHKSMRIAELIAHQYNSHSRAFISLEHHWTMVLPKSYAGRELLEILETYSSAEGDFNWGIAFHPYPQDLFNPRVWEDTEIKFSFDTPKITFKNLEVLDAWVKQPRYLYQGKTLRAVQLTEQGLNSMDYSEKALADQAAGMAYAWNKVKNLDSIEVFDYHNWVDNRGEGGLRIGLRRFPDDKEDPLGKKPVWYVYQALDSPTETQTLEVYKKIVGIKAWTDVVYRGKIK